MEKVSEKSLRKREIDAMLRLYDELYAEKVSENFETKKKAFSLMNRRVGEEGIVPFARHDSTVIGYLDTLANGMVSAIMPESDYWFRFTTWGANTASRGKVKARKGQENVLNSGKWTPDIVLLDSVKGAKDYFEDCSQKILSHFSHSNYYTSMDSVVRDGLVGGMGVLQSVDDVANDACYYRCISPLEVCARKGDDGKIEIYFRRYRMSPLALFMRYRKSTPEQMMENLQGGMQTLYTITEAILPKGLLRDPSTGERFTEPPKNGSSPFRYDHYVYCQETDMLLEGGGFAEMPITIWNYKETGTVYGQGLFEQIVPEIVDLDNLKLNRAKSLAYSTNPAWQVTPNAARHFSVKGGSVNVVAPSVQGGSEIQAIQKPEVYDKYTADIQDMRAQIRELCYIDLYKTVLGSTDTRKTATEINISKTEASQLLTSTIGNLQSCVTDIVKRTFSILKRREEIAPPESREIAMLIPYIRVEFDSVFIQRMRSYYMVEGNLSILNMLQVISAFYPDIRYTLDMDRLIRMLASGLGVSEYAIREVSETESMKKRAAEMAQMQMQMQNNQIQSQTNMQNARAQSLLAGGGNAAVR